MGNWTENAFKKIDALYETSLLQVEYGIPAMTPKIKSVARHLISFICLDDIKYFISAGIDGSIEFELRFNNRTIYFNILDSGTVEYTDIHGEKKIIHGGLYILDKKTIQQIIGGE
jgi:hypothetical protein